MRKAGQELPVRPEVPHVDVRRLRATLILEEAHETIMALGFSPVDLSREFYHPDIVSIADGCADLSVVTIGTLSACGIPDRRLLETVDRWNNAKFGPGSTKNVLGKWIKPPDFQGPSEDIKRYIEELCRG